MQVDHGEYLEENVAHILKEGDLSPRQVDNFKSGIRRQQGSIPLQVQTRSSKERGGQLSQ